MNVIQRYRTLASICIISMSSHFALAQIELPSQLYFEHYTVEDGLASNNIRDITQDGLGNIWVATQHGVTKYDGYDFITYRNIPSDPNSLSENDVYQIKSGPDGEIWANNIKKVVFIY